MDRKSAMDLALISLNSVGDGKIEAENIDIITIELDQDYSPSSLKEIEETIARLGKELEVDVSEKEK